MEKQILEKLEIQEKKIDSVYESVEKTRKYFLITLIVSLIAFIVPLIALLMIIPIVLNSFSQSFEGLL